MEQIPVHKSITQLHGSITTLHICHVAYTQG